MPRKILIVDDSEMNRAMLKNVLRHDYDILEAENGREALSMMHKHYKMLSAVLLDIVMPEMDGYEVLRAIRDNVLLSQIPVIMVTGSDDNTSREKALSLGANDFILKPFNPAIVEHCLRNNIALRETASILNAIQKDKLTGLYNREAFFEKVSGMVADREAGYYVLSCFDIDNFKLINDQYGAAEGDRVLREIGVALKQNAEEIGGVAGRISSDNFAALFPADKKITVVLQKILDRNLVSIEQQAVSFSIGRYVVNDLSLPASAIYDRAFIAKRSVKGRYDEHLAYFDDTMLEKLIREQEITGEMETALRTHQFEAWFQPQYNHASGALLGAEALVRWHHPQKGIISPGEFIPLFEENGFVYELDKYIWREVCGYLRKWMDEGRSPLPISVNISRYDVLRVDLIEVLGNLIKEYDIPVDLLRLEITESAFASSSNRIVTVVKQLIDIGFTVEIDDFGSGYSSLNTLKDVPAQVVKLDMRFLSGTDDFRRGGNILESIVRMTKWLGMTVLAEGVEEIGQADFLKSIGCSYVQGYLYAHPMNANEFEKLLDGVAIEEHPFISGNDELLFTDAFWDPKSIDSMIFNKYSGGACVYEYHNGRIEMVRVTDKYIHTVFGPSMSASDAIKIDWSKYADKNTNAALEKAMLESIETREEVSGDYLFLNLPGCERETYLHSSLRVIASTDDRHLVYCTSINITRQVDAERQSAMAADRLQAVLDNVSCGITAIVYNGDDVEYLMINDRYYELLGYTKEQYKKIETFSPIYPDDRERVIEASKKVYATAVPATIEYRAVKRGGERIWMRVSMTMATLAGVDKAVQIGIFSDITSERLASRELLDNMPCGAARYEYDGNDFRVIHINKRYWELVDRAPVDYEGLSIMTSVHPDDRLLTKTEVDSAIRQNRDFCGDIRIRSSENEYRPFHVVGRALPKGDGKYFINAIYSPISNEVMSIQEMLPIALQSVMDSSSEISFVKDKNERYISCSRKFARLLGFESERELIGKTAFELFPASIALQYVAADKVILESGKSYVDIDTMFQAKDALLHLEFSKYPLRDAQGNTLGIYGTGHDITETRTMKSRLELLTNNVPGGIAIYEGTPDALDKIRLTYFSDGFCRLFGYTRNEYEALCAHNPLASVFSADVKKMNERIYDLINNGIPMDYVYRARVHDGTYKWINVKAVMGEPNGSNLTVNAVLFDVTEQRTALEKLRVSEEINRLAIEQSKTMVCRYDIAKRKITLPPKTSDIFGFASSKEDVPYSSVRENKISPDTADSYVAFYEKMINGEKSGDVLFKRMSTLAWRWIEGHFTTIFSDSGEPDTAVISFADVTESIEKDAAYKKWRQSFSDKNPHSYSLYHCNISRNTVLDVTEGMLIPETLDDCSLNMDERTSNYAKSCVLEEDRKKYLSVMNRDVQLSRFAKGKTSDTLDYREYIGGAVRWLRVTVDLMELPYSDEVEAYLLFEDIDKEKRAQLEIIERAQTDPLTGVLNRSTFSKKVDDMISTFGETSQHALLMLDIDGFKMVNDVFGHGAGDQSLIDIAHLLRKNSRRGDLVGRLGGDEFVVFLPDISKISDAADKARQICAMTRKTYSVEVQVSGSVGIALYPKDGGSFEELYKKADDTLYCVKDNGKNSYAFYGDERQSAKDAAKMSQQEKASSDNIKKRRMLIVDDSKIDYELLANLFKNDFNIEKATDGNAALIKLHHYGSAISVVLLDLMMPGIDGYAVLEKMQQSTDTKFIPVIVVSATDDRETILKVVSAGAADLVTKPVDPDLLKIRVNAAISKAENERLRAQNSFLALQNDEINSYKTVLERMGTLVIVHDWGKGTFSYSPSVAKHLYGRYDGRSLWRILLSDLVADSQTVRLMQSLVHDVANDRNRTEASMEVRLKSFSGGKRTYKMNVYKESDDFGLTNTLLITFKEDNKSVLDK